MEPYRHRIPASLRHQIPFSQMPPAPPPQPYVLPPSYCVFETQANDPGDIWGFNLYDDYTITPELTNKRFLRVYM